MAEDEDPATRLLGSARYLTGDQVAERAGIDKAEADALWQALGFPHLGDDVAFADGDVRALQQAREQLVDLLQPGLDFLIGPRVGAQAQVLGHRQGAEHAPTLGRLCDAGAHNAVGASVQQAVALEAHRAA